MEVIARRTFSLFTGYEAISLIRQSIKGVLRGLTGEDQLAEVLLAVTEITVNAVNIKKGNDDEITLIVILCDDSIVIQFEAESFSVRARQLRRGLRSGLRLDPKTRIPNGEGGLGLHIVLTLADRVAFGHGVLITSFSRGISTRGKKKLSGIFHPNIPRVENYAHAA